MTRLPIESRMAVDRPDLPEYELNRACPITGDMTGLECHHIFRRSAGYPSWWVELPDGEIIGNRIMLSSRAHHHVTVNKARIVYEGGVYSWEEAGERVPLRWQPPTMHRRQASNVVERIKSYTEDYNDRQDRRMSSRYVAQAEVDQYVAGGHEKFENKVDFVDEVVSERPGVAKILALKDLHVEPGEDCPACKRRIPLPKKKTSPKTRVFSTRVPIDDADTFKEMVDAAAEHMGIKEKPHHEYKTLLVGLALVLQAPKEELPGG